MHILNADSKCERKAKAGSLRSKHHFPVNCTSVRQRIRMGQRQVRNGMVTGQKSWQGTLDPCKMRNTPKNQPEVFCYLLSEENESLASLGKAFLSFPHGSAGRGHGDTEGHSNVPAFSVLYNAAFLFVGHWVLYTLQECRQGCLLRPAWGRGVRDDWGGCRESRTRLDPL